jgi:ubiquinone/menaquinone biosynthesis C-methylase UbiE
MATTFAATRAADDHNNEHNNEQIRGVFNDAASYYQNLRWFKTPLTRFEYGQTERVLLEQLRPGATDHLLEIGPGPGTWTKVVAPHVKRVTAVDISENMLEQARHYVESPNVTFINGDAAEYQPDEPLDGFYSVRVLEYVRGWERMLSRVAAHVAVGGRATVITKTPFSVYRGTGRELSVIAVPRHLAGRLKRKLLHTPEHHITFWQTYIKPLEMAAVLRANGFEDVEVRPVIVGLPIFMRGTCQYPIVPPALEGAFLRAFDWGFGAATNAPTWLRDRSLFFSESYAISATKAHDVR